VSTNRLIKFWTNANELPGLVALSLSKTIKTYPAIGWVRSNSIGDSSLLMELNDLRKENTKLKEDSQTNSSQNSNSFSIDSKQLADFEDELTSILSFCLKSPEPSSFNLVIFLLIVFIF
jgi:hypothetical protein